MAVHTQRTAIPLHDDPTIRAEMATLGAMLIGPELISHAGDLTPADFRSPIHAALAEVILDAGRAGLAAHRPPPRPGRPAGSPRALTQWTTQWLHNTVWSQASQHPDMRGVSPDYLLQLIAASPYPPRIGWYAQTVRDQAARARIAALAVQHAANLAEPMTVTRLDAALRQAGIQIRSAAEGLTPPTTIDRDARLLPTEPENNGPAQLLPRPPPAPEIIHTEDQLLGALLAHNRLIDPVVRIVSPGDLHAPGRSLIYALIEDMHRQDIPVDAVTIARAADWLGALSSSRVGDGRLTLDQLFRLAHSTDQARAVELARQVQRNGIRLNLRRSLRHLVSTANHADVPARAVREEVTVAVEDMAAMRGRLSMAEEVKDRTTLIVPHLGR